MLNKKNILLRIISVPIIIIAIIACADTLINLLNPAVTLPWNSLVYSLFITAFLFVIGNVLLCLSFKSLHIKETFSKILVKTVFTFYCIAAIVVLFSNGTFARDVNNNEVWNSSLNGANFIPFKTIIGYLQDIIYKSLEFGNGNVHVC